MSSIAERLQGVRATLPKGITLVAVSKYHSEEEIGEAYAAGQRDFGENHAQELARKAQTLPNDIRWHFIGHLQTNKVKLIMPYVSLIHAVDSWHLLSEINKQALRLERNVDVLLQLHVAEEETKFGLTPDEYDELLSQQPWRELSAVRIRGVMAMATHTDDEAQIAEEFEKVDTIFKQSKANHFADMPHFDLRSYGMSDDYPIALRHGSNIVRIGTAIFGPRQYQKTSE